MSDRAQRYLHAGAPRGFTLIEVLLAMAIFTVLVGALYSVFYGALRLRERTFEVTEAALPKDYIATIVKRDLTSIVPPVGILAGPMIGENEEDGEQRLDSLEFHTGSGIGETFRRSSIISWTRRNGVNRRDTALCAL